MSLDGTVGCYVSFSNSTQLALRYGKLLLRESAQRFARLLPNNDDILGAVEGEVLFCKANNVMQNSGTKRKAETKKDKEKETEEETVHPLVLQLFEENWTVEEWKREPCFKSCCSSIDPKAREEKVNARAFECCQKCHLHKTTGYLEKIQGKRTNAKHVCPQECVDFATCPTRALHYHKTEWAQFNQLKHKKQRNCKSATYVEKSKKRKDEKRKHQFPLDLNLKSHRGGGRSA
jgi:hypothetical protein